MVLKIHYDAPYLSETQVRSLAERYFFLLRTLEYNKPIKSNVAIHTLCSFLKSVTSCAAEAEIGAIFVNFKEEKILCLTIE